MIVVKIEMWPLGIEKEAYPLGRMYIWNKGTAHSLSGGKRGDYGFAVMRKNKLGMEPKIKDLKKCRSKECVAIGNVDNWPRLSYNVWKLVKKCLEQTFK